MPQIIRRTPRPEGEKRPSFSQQLSQNVNSSLDFASEIMQKRQEKESLDQENEQIRNNFGVDLSGVVDKKLRRQMVQAALQGATQSQLEGLKQRGALEIVALALAAIAPKVYICLKDCLTLPDVE